jgi:hypothetical protein
VRGGGGEGGVVALWDRHGVEGGVTSGELLLLGGPCFLRRPRGGVLGGNLERRKDRSRKNSVRRDAKQWAVWSVGRAAVRGGQAGCAAAPLLNLA